MNFCNFHVHGIYDAPVWPKSSAHCLLVAVVLCFFLRVSWVGLQCVILTFTGHTHSCIVIHHIYSKTCLKRPLKMKTEIDFQDRLWEHSAILLTFTKLPFVIKIFVLSIFEWPLKTVMIKGAVCCFFHSN